MSKTILWCSNLQTSADEFRKMVEAVDRDNYLAVLIHAPLPTHPISFHGGLSYGGAEMAVDFANKLKESKEALAALTDTFKAIMLELECTGDVRPVLCATADIQHMVELSARYADVVTFAPSLSASSDVMKEMVHSCLFRSPVGALLNCSADLTPENVMVAWDESRAASRAVHLSLPYLKQAKSVTIACFDPTPMTDGHAFEPGAALSVWLAHHGCRVTVVQAPSGGREIADCITDRARELGVDLIVMGGYGHSRLRQAVFGGTTRTMMEQTEHAVFLAH